MIAEIARVKGILNAVLGYTSEVKVESISDYKDMIKKQERILKLLGYKENFYAKPENSMEVATTLDQLNAVVDAIGGKLIYTEGKLRLYV